MLLRALRDFNLGKLTADDTGIFMGLLNDLFPKTVELVPRAIDREFEPKASVSKAIIAAAAVCTTMINLTSTGCHWTVLLPMLSQLCSVTVM